MIKDNHKNVEKAREDRIAAGKDYEDPYSHIKDHDESNYLYHKVNKHVNDRKNKFNAIHGRLL